MLSGYRLPTNLSSGVLKEITEGAAVHFILMQKYGRSISYARISCPGFVFRAKTGFAPAESVAADKSANSIRPRSSSRPRGGTYLKIPVARTFQFVIGNICARACALCNFGTLCIAPWLLGHGSDINHPLNSFGDIPPLQSRLLCGSFTTFPSPLCFLLLSPCVSLGEIIPCLSCTLISRRRTTPLFDRCRVSWKRL